MMSKQQATIPYADTAFTRCVLSTPEEFLDLGKAALLIAQEEYPGLDVNAYLARLDTMATRVRMCLPTQPSVPETILAINHTLFDDQGLTGNLEDYYDPRNSFLNDVMDRKLGIPISLSIVYLEVGRRVGLALEGVGFPGHFLVKLPLADGDLLVDPFNGGRSLSQTELANRAAERFGAQSPPSPSYLLKLIERISKKEILARMLRNLKNIYLHKNELTRALTTSNQLLAATPHSAMDIRDRGRILEYLECSQAAATDYQRYLQLAPHVEDYDEIRSRMIALRKIIPSYN